MSLTLTVKPTMYPVTLAEVKENSRIEHTDDDALLYTFIAAATDYVEIYTRRDLIQRTYQYKTDKFPTGTNKFCLPRFPILSVSSVVYTDVTTSPQANTLATTVYGLSNSGGTAYLYLKYNQSWPSYSIVEDGITVTFVSGYEGLGSPQDLRGNIPDAVRGAIMMIAGDLYEHRESKLDIQTYKNDTVDMLLNAHRLYHL